jgi:acyl-CoA synthetase (AMP-forming)/AMP-acid ligase II
MAVSDIVLCGRDLYGDRIALSDGVTSRTWRETAARVSRIAGLLVEERVGPGDRVLLLSPNGPAVVEVLLAAALIGAAVVPVNHRLAGPEVAYQMRDAAAALSVVHPEFLELATRSGLLNGPHIVLDDALEQRLASVPPFADARTDPGSVLVQLYTSGTTGNAKGCLLTQRNWLASATSFAHAYDIHCGDVVLVGLPLFHVAALGWVLATLLAGGSVVIPHDLDEAGLWETVARERVTVVAAPFIVRAALKHPMARESAGTLRMMVGAPTRRAAEVVPHVELVSGYGATELCGQVTAIRGADHRRHPDSVGRLMAGYAAEIVGEDGAPVGLGETGELLVRGAGVTSGYWQLPAASDELLRNGWLHTGDLVRADEEGFIYFVDRLKDMIKTGGENVYSAEVEQALASHANVREVAVFGVPDERWGQAVKAVVVSASAVQPEELDAWCLERIAAYKRPRWYESAESLPRNASGKVLKRELRDEHDPSVAQRRPER